MGRPTAIGTVLMAIGIGSTVGRPARRCHGSDDDRAGADRPRPDGGAGSVEASGGGFGERLEVIDRLQKRWRPVAFVVAVIKKYAEDGGGRLAAVVAYYGFFSVFPALLALVAVAGFVLDADPGLRDEVVDSALAQFPVIGDGIAEQSLGGSGVALAVGLVGALWAGLGAMLAAQHGLNEVWDVPWHERPDPLRSRLRGLLMFVVFGLALVAATTLTNLVAALSLPTSARVGILAANLVVDIGVALLAFQILGRHATPWSTLLPGAVIAGTGYVVLQQLGSFVIRRYVSGAGDTYGTFALVIGLLAWFHLLAQLTLLAAEVDVVRTRRLWPRTIIGDDLTDGDHRALHRHQLGAARHRVVEDQVQTNAVTPVSSTPSPR